MEERQLILDSCYEHIPSSPVGSGGAVTTAVASSLAPRKWTMVVVFTEATS